MCQKQLEIFIYFILFYILGQFYLISYFIVLPL